MIKIKSRPALCQGSFTVHEGSDLVRCLEVEILPQERMLHYGLCIRALVRVFAEDEGHETTQFRGAHFHLEIFCYDL